MKRENSYWRGRAAMEDNLKLGAYAIAERRERKSETKAEADGRVRRYNANFALGCVKIDRRTP